MVHLAVVRREQAALAAVEREALIRVLQQQERQTLVAVVAGAVQTLLKLVALAALVLSS